MFITLKIGLTLFLEDLGRLFFEPMGEVMQYDMAAATMELEGYTDLEIYNELGPRPKSNLDNLMK